MFLERLKQEIEHRRFLPSGAKLLIGVSGGPDSIALLHGLLHLKEEYGWSLYVVHVNHQLRGEESEEDARYVQNCCERWQIPYLIERVDVKEALQTGGNKQTKARELRYQAFQKAAHLWNVDCLVLAHHADDQMETILMRIIRGTGVSGLTGIEPEREWNGMKLVRPILSISKAEIEAYCDEHQLHPRIDQSNYSFSYTRNRIRHQLIPQLATFNPKVREAFLQLSDIVREEEKVWQELVNEAMSKVMKERTPECVILQVSSFRDLSVALQRRIVKLILSCLSHKGIDEATLESVEQVRWLISQPHPSISLDLPGGLIAKREYEDCIIQVRKTVKIQKGDRNSLQLTPIFIPGMTSIPDFRGKIEVIISPSPIHNLKPCLDSAVFDADVLQEPVFVRKRQPGDIMTCFGMNGRKKLKNLLMEARVPRDQRDKVPILVAGEQILWVPGIRRSNLAIVTPDTKRYLYFLWHTN